MTHRDVDDTPNLALPVLCENSPDIVGLREVGLEGIYLCALELEVCGVRGKLALGQLGDADESLGFGIVVVVNRDDLVAPGLLQGVDDMGA